MERQRFIQIVFSGILFLTLIAAFVLARYYRLKRRANDQLQKLNTELSSKNKLVAQQKEDLASLDRAKSKLYTNITHEFRTPLTVIAGINAKMNIDKEFKSIVKRNTDQLLHLVNQMLDLRKLESGEIKLNYRQGDIIQPLRYLAESIQSLAESKNLSIHFLPKREEVMMDFDQDKVARIHTNLLSNAIKFSDDGDNIYISR